MLNRYPAAVHWAVVVSLLLPVQAATPQATALLPAAVLRNQATVVSRTLLPAFSPQGWLALVCAPERCELRPVGLALGVPESGVEGWSIEAPNRKPPVRGEFTVVLLKGLAAPAGTVVPTYFTLRSPRRVEDATAGSMGVRLDAPDGRRWQLVPRWNPTGEPRLRYYLEGGGARPQALGQIGMEAVGQGVGPKDLLIWAGDLDGDGRIDLITRTTPQASVPGLALWLSSRAAAGAQVGLAAQLEAWSDVTEAEGC
jgi:hypothetical protein